MRRYFSPADMLLSRLCCRHARCRFADTLRSAKTAIIAACWLWRRWMPLMLPPPLFTMLRFSLRLMLTHDAATPFSLLQRHYAL